MTDEKKPFSEYFLESLDKIDGAIRKDNPAFYKFWQIACIMRRAAGLPHSDTPATMWREEGTPEITSSLFKIIYTAGGRAIVRPKEISDQIYKLRYSLRDLKRQILSIDEQVLRSIDVFADPYYRQYMDKIDHSLEYHSKEDFNLIAKGVFRKVYSPDYQGTIKAFLEHMGRLEDGLADELEQAEKDVREQTGIGQPRTYAAKIIAINVAIYMLQVNGKIPGFYIEDNPRGYAKAVLEIFDLFDIPHGGLQTAVTWAIAEIKDNIEELQIELGFKVLQK